MLAKRSIGVAIVLFWCFMNAWLLKRELWAPPSPITLRSTARIAETIEEWWGVYYRGEKIGYAHQTIRPETAGYKVHDASDLRLQLLGATRPVSTRLEIDVDEEWALRRFDFNLQSNDIKFRARGEVTAGKLTLDVESAGNTTRKEISLSQAPYLMAALKPYVATQQLEPGKQHFFSTFDPATLSQQTTAVTIEGREHIRIGQRLEPAIRIRQQFKGISVVSWIDGTGRTLREESPAGLSLVQQSADEARSLSGSRSVPLDLVTQTAITPDKPILTPARKHSLTLKLTGVKLANFPMVNGSRQRLEGERLHITRDGVNQLPSISLPVRDRRLAAFLESTPFLQSDHPRIRALAKEIVRGEQDARSAAVRIKDWVYREIAKEPTVSIPNALEVLQTKKGDCNEHTVLFNALARAAGIPAKTAIGIVYLRGAFYYHAWSEIWLGEWISLDAVLDQFPADVTHVKFLEGEIDRQIDILQLIGALKIQVLEAG
jgi:hypothetical protein